MLIREISEAERDKFDRVATHPLQSYAWGEFRKKTGLKVERVGIFDAKGLVSSAQVTIHPIPKTSYTIGYLPRGVMPDGVQLKALTEIGKRNNSILVKLEPNVAVPVKQERLDAFAKIKEYLRAHGCQDGRSLFTKHTFQIDLTLPEVELLTAMKSKTRYNIGVAQRQGVTVVEDNSLAAFEEYLRLTQETTQRQQFYAHTPEYHKLMWREMHKAGIARLLVARYQGKVLVAWIFFVFNGVLYYPYGASSSEQRELMASNLIMWEGIKWGKKMGCRLFDMWGALGPDPNPRDPWYGFHRFKEGYGGQLVEFLGTYDLVLKPQLYKLYRASEEVRWKVLKIYAKLASGLSIFKR